jgi:hypothetical protein
MPANGKDATRDELKFLLVPVWATILKRIEKQSGASYPNNS